MNDEEIREILTNLFTTQRLGVVATDMDGLPYTTLVAFVATDDLKHIIFATLRDTRKFENILNSPRVSILIDNRGNNPSDFYEAIAVTAEGNAEVMERVDQELLNLYTKKHPYLTDFVTSQNCALIKIEVHKYHFVSRFQNVNIVVPKE